MLEAKPLFRPDVPRSHLWGFSPPTVDSARLEHWADLIATGRIDNFGEEPDRQARAGRRIGPRHPPQFGRLCWVSE
jgi:hypothetical protein